MYPQVVGSFRIDNEGETEYPQNYVQSTNLQIEAGEDINSRDVMWSSVLSCPVSVLECTSVFFLGCGCIHVSVSDVLSSTAPNLKGRPRKKRLSICQRRDSQGQSGAREHSSSLENKSPVKVVNSLITHHSALIYYTHMTSS